MKSQQFLIYEFSKKFDNIQQKDGIWVSGGFEIDQTKAFFRSNHENGTVDQIPVEIRKAVVDGLFKIPNAYPPKQLNDKEFLQRVKNGQLNIANPPLEDIALIARELNDYCVLAVATCQIDDKWRPKMVGYRYFWLKTSELNPERPDLVDGIATLLLWWFNQGKPCFDMNPASYENSPNKNQPYPGTKVMYEHHIIQQHRPLYENYKSNLPLLFTPHINGQQLDFWVLHAQALRLRLRDNEDKAAWAWNVRKLTQPETFKAVYCPDRQSYEQFFSRDSQSITQSSASRSQSNQPTIYPSSKIPSSTFSKSDPLTFDHSTTSQDDSDVLEKCLKDVANNTDSPSLGLLIEFYPQKSPKGSGYKPLWQNCLNQESLNNPQKKRYQADINLLILVAVFIWNIQPHNNSKSNQRSPEHSTFTDEEKNWALDYLRNLSASISQYADNSNIIVSQLKQNIKNVQQTLSDEDQSSGGNGDWSSDVYRWVKLFIGGIARQRFFVKLLIFALPLLLLAFFFLIPKTNRLNSIFSGYQDSEKISEQSSNEQVQQLKEARKFIAEKLMTTECKEGGSSVDSSECKIYLEIKEQLPDWPALPEPPENAAIPAGQSSPLKMLARTRNENNPPELVLFLRQSLQVIQEVNTEVGNSEQFNENLENSVIGNSEQFDENLENAVKDFQAKFALTQDGQVGEETWIILSNYVQKKQVIAILDYRIESLNNNKNDKEIQKKIQICKNLGPGNLKKFIKPQDFMECVTSIHEEPKQL